MSIYRGLGAATIALLQLIAPVAMGAATAPGAGCTQVLDGSRPYFRARLVTVGTQAAQTRIGIAPGHEWLIEAREQGNDAVVEVLDGAGRVLAQADHPERRSGTRRALIAPGEAQWLTLRVTGKEHAAVTGRVELVVFDVGGFGQFPQCVRALRSLVAGDADYAMAQKISLGYETATTTTARAIYLRAAGEYSTAETLLDDPADAALRGEAALAVAGVRYFDLQDWRGSVHWASLAEAQLGSRDPYRSARAQALGAAAWLEIATDIAPRSAKAGAASDPKVLLEKARRTLQRLVLFHNLRQEGYDAALQVNNIALAYLYEGRFLECIPTALNASRMFAALTETPRQALAWQNRALCYWGIGQLPAALGAFNQALKNMRPDPYPQLYLLTLNNTALLNFALGHFDESLRLHGDSLDLAIRVQNRREEAQSLYGIGVTYYALGDIAQAREYLERSLAIRSAAFDGRGRRATLRSLATVHADLGEYGQAIEFDREAVALAMTPTSLALSRIPLAAHLALAGKTAEALDILGALIGQGGVADPLVSAQARLQRASIERQSALYEAAMRDLKIASPVFERDGSVTDAFAADLERARILQLEGKWSAARVTVDRALQRSEAMRTQTANPEFRAQLQLPLRAAYDLQLDLLWRQFDTAVKAGNERAAAGIAAVAFRRADAGRARSFADIAAEQYSVAVRHELKGDLARREILYGNLAGLRFALDARLDRAGSGDARARKFASEIAGLQREVDILNNRIAARAAGHGGRADVGSLPADSAIIAYWLGAHAAYAWTVTAAGIHWARLAEPGTISMAAREFHDALTRLADVARERRWETAAVLSGEIIRPIGAWASPYRRWFFVPDAALDYVPFAALRTDSGSAAPYLIMVHDVALTPAAWMLLAKPRRREWAAANDRMLLVSDPVYERSDPRLPVPRSQGGRSSASAAPAGSALIMSNRSYQRIPGTAREARAIENELAAADIDSLSGVEASRERLLRLDWSQYRYIHIASHGYVDARMPQLSAVILSGYDERGEPIDAAVRAADLSTLTLSADVAVFSGCDTALGKEVLNEGMVGVAYAALARGAGAVVSSLWQVSDEISASLMTEFYRHLVRDSMNPVTSLSTSMRSLVSRNPSADPALWAAFQVSVVTIERLGPAAGGDAIALH